MKHDIDIRLTDTFGYNIVCMAEITDGKVVRLNVKTYNPNIYRELKLICDI